MKCLFISFVIFFIGLIGLGVYSSPLYMLSINPLLRVCVTGMTQSDGMGREVGGGSG